MLFWANSKALAKQLKHINSLIRNHSRHWQCLEADTKINNDKTDNFIAVKIKANKPCTRYLSLTNLQFGNG